MQPIDLQTLSKLVTEKLGKETEFNNIEKIGGGYHSDGFKLKTRDGRQYFLKYVRSHNLGFEFPERQIMSLTVSNGMMNRSGEFFAENPKAVGVVLINDKYEGILPNITAETKVYHLQEFAGIGKSYSSILAANKNKKTVDAADRAQLEKIADALVKIHSVKHPGLGNKERTDAAYQDGIRSMLTHPELSLMAISEFPIDYKILNLEEQKEYIGLIYENIKHWMPRSDRLSSLHGDFWGANIFFREDDSLFVIDFSRIPWGDPAIDAGWFIAEYLWGYHETGNSYYKELIETWFDIYEKKSADHEVRKAVTLVLGWIGIVEIYPRWYPDRNTEMARRFINHIRTILKKKEFVWM